ncbi:MAG TPA: VWA domain-containing protein [Candidatus Angelobacter sp.]|nr:VWA domain-containing protein [Candidatus Angelobacter sp.]
MSGKPVLFATICLFILSSLLIAQQPSPTPAATQSASATDTKQPSTQPSTMSVTVKVVNVPATVRDKHGKIISTLGKDDFVLEEDGRPQTIRYFAHDTDLPLTLGLLVDTSLSQRRVLEEERHASYSFLDQMLHQAKDVAFVIHFDHEVELLQDLTANREKLDSALQTMQTSPNTSQQQTGSQSGNSGGGSNGGGSNGGSSNGSGYPGGGYPGGRGSGRHGGHSSFGGGTLLYDAAYLASDELMKKQQGRKALIILSDGVDHGSKVGLETAIATAQKSDTVVYAILFKDDESNGRGFGGMGGGMGGGPYGGGMGRHGGGQRYPQESRPDGKKILERIAKETGGQLFEVSKKQPIDKIYASIAEDLRNQYNLGYTPDRPSSDGGYHKIILRTKEKDVTVQARDGYYASHPSE